MTPEVFHARLWPLIIGASFGVGVMGLLHVVDSQTDVFWSTVYTMVWFFLGLRYMYRGGGGPAG